MKILRFFNRTDPPPDKHYGLFSVSAGDIIISRPLFELLITRLRHGTPEQRIELATQLADQIRGMY